LRGGVSYRDAQFDDARLAIALMRTAHRLGAFPINYVGAESIELRSGRVGAVVATDRETGERLRLEAGVVFNATGVWVDAIRQLADHEAAPIVTVSRGSHVLVPRGDFPPDLAMTIPRTSDGRVLFVLPWRGALMLGTTDVPVGRPVADPHPAEDEIEFVLRTARAYLDRGMERSDVIGCFAGLRPLFAPRIEGATKTISREHSILVERGNLVTITGGKWTTYRRMAEDALHQAARRDLVPDRISTTGSMRLDVDPELEAACHAAEADTADGMQRAAYGRLARRFEQARTDEDIQLRRMRLDIDAKKKAAPKSGL
jgi:glycerol-3-phosphate dehydrogenase